MADVLPIDSCSTMRRRHQ